MRGIAKRTGKNSVGNPIALKRNATTNNYCNKENQVKKASKVATN
jgi:hypothetical protein